MTVRIPAGMTERLSIGLVTFNHGRVVGKTLRSVVEALPANIPAHIWVLDNNSQDGTLAAVQQIAAEDSRVSEQAPSHGRIYFCGASCHGLKTYFADRMRRCDMLDRGELSRQVQQSGWRTLYCPEAVVLHEWRRDAHRSSRAILLFCASAVRYFNKWVAPCMT